MKALVGMLCFGRAASLALQSPCWRQPSWNSQHEARCSAFHMTEGSNGPSLRQLVQKDRLIRKAGVGAGAVFVAAAAGLGSSAGIISGEDLLRVALCGGTLAAGLTTAKFLSNQESQPPCPASHFEVAPSPGKGSGLFATCAIEPGTYLFDYEGEILDEDAFFARYPNADGRYIAGLTDDYYIDGKSPPFEPIRWSIMHAT